VVPHRTFELDRFFLPKEVVLHATAALVALLVIPGRREWSWSRTDLLLLGYLGLTLLSAVFATNGWLAPARRDHPVGLPFSGHPRARVRAGSACPDDRPAAAL
jgi:hypothetical protein